MFKYVRIWQNDKKLEEWGKTITKKLKNERLVEHFQSDFVQMKSANSNKNKSHN